MKTSALLVITKMTLCGNSCTWAQDVRLEHSVCRG